MWLLVKIILQAWHCSCVLANDGPMWPQCQPITGKTYVCMFLKRRVNNYVANFLSSFASSLYVNGIDELLLFWLFNPQSIESRLKVTLPDDLLASLADGVVLCHLINNIRKGMIPSIHIPSAGVVSAMVTHIRECSCDKRLSPNSKNRHLSK